MTSCASISKFWCSFASNFVRTRVKHTYPCDMGQISNISHNTIALITFYATRDAYQQNCYLGKRRMQNQLMLNILKKCMKHYTNQSEKKLVVCKVVLGINTKKYHLFAPMGRFQLESIYLYFPPSSQLVYLCFCPVGLSLL